MCLAADSLHLFGTERTFALSKHSVVLMSVGVQDDVAFWPSLVLYLNNMSAAADCCHHHICKNHTFQRHISNTKAVTSSWHAG